MPRLDSCPRAAAPRAAVGVAPFPRVLAENPYQRLLYEALAEQGVHAVADSTFTIGWLARNRGRVGILHFHWPDAYYRVARRGVLGAVGCGLKLALLALRLRVARALGYRVVWTVHQVVPHERRGRLDLLAARTLARACDLLIAHEPATALRARAELDPPARIAIVPHLSYAGVYPPGRSRDEVRAELGLADGDVAFLLFGQLRADKDVGVLLDAFAAAPANARLVVAGRPEDAAAVAAVGAAATDDPRIAARIGHVADGDVAELFGACDAAVLPRGDGGTSGSLVLALSLGLPVVAADTPANASALGGGRAGWLFAPGDADSLAHALCDACGSQDRTGARLAVVRELAAARDRRPIAAATASLLRSTGPRRRAVDVLLVCSSGGHLLQLVALHEAWERYDRAWVTLPTPDARSLLHDEDVTWAHGPTARNVPNLLRNLVLADRVVRRTRPAVVLTTGAAIAVPFAVVARLRGARFVYVESITRTRRASLSCRLVRPLAHDVYAQWPELAARLRGARYAGGVVAAP